VPADGCDQNGDGSSCCTGNYQLNNVNCNSNVLCLGQCDGTCSDGICCADIGENTETCCVDCGHCGDGICCADAGENTETCYNDCSCGDGICDTGVGENIETCCVDCGYCGDGYCCYNEDETSCPADCPGGGA